MISSESEARRTLLITSAATALVLVAFTIPLALLASIAPDLGAAAVGQSWILSSMSVGLAGALLVSGSLADDLGRRRVFLAGLTLFAVGAFACAAAPSVLVLAAGRGAQGIGGAAILASALSLIAHAHPQGPTRVHATGVWGASLGAGIAIGPLAGALMGNWRVAYVVLGVVAVAALMPAARALTESRSSERTPIDPVGAVMLGGGLTALTAGVVQGNATSWSAVVPLIALTLAALLLASFAGWELRSTAPLFDVRLMIRASFAGALIGSFVLGGTVLAFMSYSVAFMHTVLGTSVIAAAVWVLPWSVVSFFVSIRARALGKVLSPRTQTVAGLVLCAIALLSMRGLGAGSDAAHLVPGFALLGVGTGVLNAALAHAAVSVVEPSRSGMGAGANNTARYLGAALGVPLIVGVLHSGTASRLAEGATRIAAATGAMNTVLLLVAAITLAGALIVLAALTPRKEPA